MRSWKWSGTLSALAGGFAGISAGGGAVVAAWRSRADTAGAEVGGLVMEEDLCARDRSCSDQL